MMILFTTVLWDVKAGSLAKFSPKRRLEGAFCFELLGEATPEALQRRFEMNLDFLHSIIVDRLKIKLSINDVHALD